LPPGSHDFIKHDSVPSYRHAKTISINALTDLENNLKLIPKANLDGAWLLKLQDAVEDSDFTPKGVALRINYLKTHNASELIP